MDIYEIAEECLRKGQTGVLATIVKKSGATPQTAGAKVFIDQDGKLFGTVGGGCVEAEIWQESRKALKTKVPSLLRYALNGTDVENEGMICGGAIHVFLESIFEKYGNIYRDIGLFRKEGTRALTITRFGEGRFSKTLLTIDGDVIGDPLEPSEEWDKALFYEKEPRMLDGVIVEPIVIASSLTIYGAGHISQQIAMFAKAVDFRVHVMDNRAQFANRERFPEADEIIVDDFENLPRHGIHNGEGYAVIVTRGHKDDALVLEKVLAEKNRYVGMIGSKRKIKMIFDHLVNKGYDRGILERVHAPIGIDIHAGTPQEIALSIVAELVMVRGGKTI